MVVLLMLILNGTLKVYIYCILETNYYHSIFSNSDFQCKQNEIEGQNIKFIPEILRMIMNLVQIIGANIEL